MIYQEFSTQCKNSNIAFKQNKDGFNTHVSLFSKPLSEDSIHAEIIINSDKEQITRIVPGTGLIFTHRCGNSTYELSTEEMSQVADKIATVTHCVSTLYNQNIDVFEDNKNLKDTINTAYKMTNI